MYSRAYLFRIRRSEIAETSPNGRELEGAVGAQVVVPESLGEAWTAHNGRISGEECVVSVVNSWDCGFGE